jgi:hypothetical protein
VVGGWNRYGGIGSAWMDQYGKVAKFYEWFFADSWSGGVGAAGVIDTDCSIEIAHVYRGRQKPNIASLFFQLNKKTIY